MSGPALLRSGQARNVETHDELRSRYRGVQGQRPFAGCGQFDRYDGNRRRASIQVIEVFLCQRLDPVRGDIANDHQRRIVGCVPGLVPLLQLKGLQPLQVVHPAYDRGAIGAAQVGEAFQAFEAQG
ncbi:hypothetical protein D3C76_1144260 [compost metagenome]